MDFQGILTSDSESLITQQLMLTIRHAIWEQQQALRASPDPSDEWYFLVDPDAPEPTRSGWQPVTTPPAIEA